jgi:hypothetical protein
MEEHLGVRPSSKSMTKLSQLARQLDIVVDLTILGDPVAAIRSRHGLTARVTDVDDC